MKRIFAVLLALALCAGVTAAFAQGTAHCDDKDCLVCEVAKKINALPAASEITKDNAAAVINQIHAIDRIKMDLTDEEYDELLELVEEKQDVSGGGLGVPARYVDALDAVEKLTGAGSLYVQKSFDADGKRVDVSNAQVQFKLTRVDGGRNNSQILTLSTLDHAAGYYAENANGWTYEYPLAPGRYTIEEIGDSGAKVNGNDFVTTSTTYSVDGKPIRKGEAFEIKAGEDCTVSVLNFRQYLLMVNHGVINTPSIPAGYFSALDFIEVEADEPKAGEQFVGWTWTLEDESVQFDLGGKKNQKTVTFEMPRSNLTLTANYEAAGGGLDGEEAKPQGGAAPDLPQTGDPSSLMGWAALLAACGAGLKLHRRRA